MGPASGRKCYLTPAFWEVPKDKGEKIRIGGAHKWAEMLHHPYILVDPQSKGDKIRIGGAHKCCILGDPQSKGDKITIGGAHKWAEMLHHPCILGDSQSKGDKIRIGRAHKWAEMLHHPCILGDPQGHGEQNQNRWGPQVGGNATSPLHSRGSPRTRGTKSE